jgi:hypothetical protein
LELQKTEEDAMSDTVTSVEEHVTESIVDQAEVGKLLVNGGSDRYEVQWDADAKVTPMGSLVFFAQYLQTGGLMDRLCQGTPLAYSSNNAPEERDVLGTIVLSILNGQTRYAHINALRGDRVGAEVLGVSKVVSEDSVRRALKRGAVEQWDGWLTIQERAVYEPLLSEPYVLDIDNTVKPLYGHQEGAELGYNPQKPGRPSHNYHTYFIGALRVVLGVEVMPGKKSSGKHSMPGLWRMIDALPAACRPRMIRGDVSYGNENTMLEAEKRNQPYLFKLRRTIKVKKQIRELEADLEAWSDTGDGWQGTERDMKLSGWSRSRRCIFLRRPAQRVPARKALPSSTSSEFSFVELLDSGPIFEYIVLVTNDVLPLEALGQLYRDRADCENVFDEIKNQWGWAGFVTHDLKRCRIIARLIALIYNWWNVFTRLARPDQHMEAITSRPLLLHAVGRMVTTGRRKTLRLTSTHAKSNQIRRVLTRIARLLNRLARNAEHLSVEATWAIILSVAFVKWLRGKVLDPAVEGNQLILQLAR